jgi:hypothetical protein
MALLVADLRDKDMRELTAYYTYLPRVLEPHPAGGEPLRIVADGAPMRGIAPCGACHGEFASKAGVAWRGWKDSRSPIRTHNMRLSRQAAGANDINEQMRNVARAMTPQEIDAASRFYAEHPQAARPGEFGRGSRWSICQR